MYKKLVYSMLLGMCSIACGMQPWVKPTLIAGALSLAAVTYAPAAESYHEKKMNHNKVLTREGFKQSYMAGVLMGSIPGLNLYMMFQNRPSADFELIRSQDPGIRKQTDMKYYASQRGLYTGASFYLILPFIYMGIRSLR